MEATKVQLLPETLRLNSLDQAGKTRLRKQMVKEFINRQPAGKKIRLRDVVKAAGYDKKSYSAGQTFVKGMLKRGEIVFQGIPHVYGGYWSVPSLVVKPATKSEPEVKQEEKVTEPPKFHLETKSLDEFNQMASGWVTQRAKEFAWTYNSDSLRDFVRFLETGK